MTRNRLLLFLGLLIVVASVIFTIRLFSGEDNWICQNGAWVKHGQPSGPMPTGTCKDGQQAAPQKEEEKSEIPNPASKNCVDEGGKLEIVRETAGEIGVCKFNDSSSCEEWKFFRGECQKNQTKTPDLSHPYSGVITKTKTGYNFNSNGVNFQLKVPAGAAKELTERLTTEAKSGGQVVIVAEENPPLSKNLILKSFQEK